METKTHTAEPIFVSRNDTKKWASEYVTKAIKMIGDPYSLPIFISLVEALRMKHLLEYTDDNICIPNILQKYYITYTVTSCATGTAPRMEDIPLEYWSATVENSNQTFKITSKVTEANINCSLDVAKSYKSKWINKWIYIEYNIHRTIYWDSVFADILSGKLDLSEPIFSIRL